MILSWGVAACPCLIRRECRVSISCFDNETGHRAHASYHLGIDLWFDIMICAVFLATTLSYHLLGMLVRKGASAECFRQPILHQRNHNYLPSYTHGLLSPFRQISGNGMRDF